ncbi:MAG: hypothetical protein FWF05_08120 [Oscillospiraceae bacterium]|nr:hypothetical protein [Oscillospiraceae bacterium]
MAKKFRKKGCGCGIGWSFSSVTAVILSFLVNRSIGWAIVHFFLGWIYVIYWLFAHLPDYWPGIVEFLQTTF